MPHWQAKEMATNKTSNEQMLRFSLSRKSTLWILTHQPTKQKNKPTPQKTYIPHKHWHNHQPAWAAVHPKITTVQVLAMNTLPTAMEKCTKATLSSSTNPHVWFPQGYKEWMEICCPVFKDIYTQYAMKVPS